MQILVLSAPITSTAARRACVSSGTPALIDVRPRRWKVLWGLLRSSGDAGPDDEGMNL